MAALELMATKFEISMREGMAGQITGKTRRLQREAEIAQEMRLGRPDELAAIRGGKLADIGAEFDRLRDRMERDDRLADLRKNRKAQNLPAVMEEAAKSVEAFIASVNAGKSPLQAFEAELSLAENVMSEARKARLDGDKMAAAQDAVNKRLAGAGANFLKSIQVNSEQWKAPRSDVGTAAAVEDALRNKFGMEPAANVQEAMRAALEEANRLKQQDLRNQNAIIDAIKNSKPGVAAFVG